MVCPYCIVTLHFVVADWNTFVLLCTYFHCQSMVPIVTICHQLTLVLFAMIFLLYILILHLLELDWCRFFLLCTYFHHQSMVPNWTIFHQLALVLFPMNCLQCIL